MKRQYSVVVPDDSHQVLQKHLLRLDGQEDLCFATYNQSSGEERLTGIISTVILPEADEREVHGNVSFKANYFERAIRVARSRKEGLVFLHSHPFPGWQDMSHDDIVAEKRMAPASKAATGFPLLGMTIGTDQAWSARFWTKSQTEKRKYDRNWCESVRVLSDRLSVTFNDNLLLPSFDAGKQLRTISAWGQKTQEDLSRLRIGIVGLGSVGSIVAEILARTGFSKFVLIDFDAVEEKNLDRTTFLQEDVGRAKVFAMKDAIIRSATSPSLDVRCIEYSICEKEGFYASLDCDVIFSCVDRPWPRQVINFISYGHLIPAIDGGILVRSNKDNTRLIGADWKVHTVGKGRPCLECLGQYKTSNAILEKDGKLDDPSYLQGLDKSQFQEVHENVFPFSSNVASLEVLQLLSLVLAPSGLSNIGQQTFHFVTGELERNKSHTCDPNCFFPSVLGRGDSVGIEVFGNHIVAEKAREARS
ncbi:HesA/MoeB/ThiF family protein [Marinoscillum luteum]|jgi:molybdopterin-synthase adenylyltransferase|uniref:HesA/MoeB/ThiF family protein n=1 Tax=Marinoscillum luteum TaxID=861051 RepID=A0ABW7N692_9BACT